MTCEKCHEGEVRTVRVRVFSPAFVALGYACFLLALAVAVGATYYAYLQRDIKPAIDAAVAAVKETVLARLRAIDGVPDTVLREFEKRASVSDETLEPLPTEMRDDVEMLVADYNLARRRIVEAPMPEWFENRWLWAGWALAGLLAIVGGSFMVRVDADRCNRCGAPG